MRKCALTLDPLTQRLKICQNEGSYIYKIYSSGHIYGGVKINKKLIIWSRSCRIKESKFITKNNKELFWRIEFNRSGVVDDDHWKSLNLRETAFDAILATNEYP